MRRRSLLVSGLSAACTLLAGCGSHNGDDVTPEDGSLKSPAENTNPTENIDKNSQNNAKTEHTDPTKKTDDNPQDNAKYLEFHGDKLDSPTIGVDPGGSPLPNNFLTTISHSENTELQSLTQQFESPGDNGTPPQLSRQISFTSDPTPHPPVSLSQDGTAAVVEVNQFGELADETVFLSLPVTQWPDSSRKLVVTNTVELVTREFPRRTHVLKGQLKFEFTAESKTDG